MPTGSTAYHLVPADVWAAAPLDEPFRPASLATDGFVHLTHWMRDLLEVANALYRDDPRPQLVLTIDLGRVSAEWRYDGDQRYPHVYGPVDREAITQVRPMARDDAGSYFGVDEAGVEGSGDAGPESRHGLSARNDAPPSDDAFEEMVFAALDGLPAAFRERLGSVAVVVEEEASPEQLAAGRAAGLYGLYQGVPRTAWGAENAAVPSKITIFRRPHLQRYGTGPGLAAGVADTVRHEVAHHFGISDERLHELQRRP